MQQIYNVDTHKLLQLNDDKLYHLYQTDDYVVFLYNNNIQLQNRINDIISRKIQIYQYMKEFDPYVNRDIIRYMQSFI